MTEAALKQRIARQFSRAAEHYDNSAAIQKQISRDAIGLLHPGYQRLLDIGCGTGYWHKELQQHAEQLFACDLAEGMVAYADKANNSTSQLEKNATYFVADAESLPLQNNVVDGVFSSMALQWCQQIPQMFAELYRVAQPKAHAVLAILSQGSLKELDQAWSAVDDLIHTNRFVSSNSLQQLASQAGFVCAARVKDYTDWHADLRSLLASIKGIGANVVTQNPQRKVLTRVDLTRLEQAYQDHFGQDNGLPLTYSVTFLSMYKPGS